MTTIEKVDLVGDVVLDLAFTALSFYGLPGFAISSAYVAIDVAADYNAFKAIRIRVFKTIKELM
ncbi:hypothetical protein KDD30_15320 [Photobacterium sp. GJ3]|uniref:hypothetical protein n=1 Tax=Photobacterium sp. GJ3 TaxID=2829502 RepID=UPI001B8C4559|nr:hypothetical protein [Photobacterium sp. GJ3]QUJ67385.1 hypothetical protein KDD30_15320 [Photobacterium sp. GJ3]